MSRKRKADHWTPFERAFVDRAQAERVVRANIAEIGEDNFEAQVKALTSSVIWKNNRYQVDVNEAHTPENFPDMLHLSIKRIDKNPIRDWRVLQRIKNEIVGPDHEAVELFPAESRLVDSANQYHLWVLKDERVRFPFGYQDRYVTSVSPVGGKQRPIPKEDAYV